MTGRDAFKIWAPAGARWVDWVRPVPFVVMQEGPNPGVVADFGATQVAYLAHAQADTAVFVDLPGADGVKEGVALAGLGYRPIPLYNGTSPTQGAMAVVENRAIEGALCRGAEALADLEIPPTAPPAFLLDSNRTHRFKMNPSVFDNSWDIYGQDVPSADYLLAHDIRRVIVLGEGVQQDLARILYKYQKKGIAILVTDGYHTPKRVKLRKPPREED